MHRWRPTAGFECLVSLALIGFWCAGCDATTEAEATQEGSFKVLVQPRPRSDRPALPDPALWQTPLDDGELEAGRQVWVGTCITCHSTGLGGAPLIGNRELWSPRIAKGLETLIQHATEGFYGKVGEMPARGGNQALSDDEVRAAVRFMTSRAM